MINLSKKTIYILLLLMSFLFISNINVQATEIDDALESMNDLGSLHIELDENKNVEIAEVESLKEQGDEELTEGAWNKIFFEMKGFLIGLSGIFTLTFLVILIVTFVKISASSDNAQKRKELVGSLTFIFIGLAGFGSLTFFMGLAFGILK